MRILSLLVIVLLSPAAIPAGDIVGRATVIDGDTLDIRGQQIRLFGIDAPESSQHCKAESGALWRCGQRAALSLADYIGEGTVTCRPRDTDRYGRTFAVCFKGNHDLNAWLVLNGWTLAYLKYSKDYVDEEALARKNRQNIWAGQITLPWEWRAGSRGPADENEGRSVGSSPPPASGTQLSTSGCTIKGNISAKGERVYHVPGATTYAKTSINEKQGERWFCTEEEARGAGWRKARKHDQPRAPTVGIEPVDVFQPR